MFYLTYKKNTHYLQIANIKLKIKAHVYILGTLQNLNYMGPDNKTINIRHLTTRLKSYGTWQQSNHKKHG